MLEDTNTLRQFINAMSPQQRDVFRTLDHALEDLDPDETKRTELGRDLIRLLNRHGRIVGVFALCEALAIMLEQLPAEAREPAADVLLGLVRLAALNGHA